MYVIEEKNFNPFVDVDIPDYRHQVIPDEQSVLDMIYNWHNNYYPILVEPTFNYWVHKVAPYVKTVFAKQKTPKNLSDITFSVLIYPNGEINPSRFYIGTLELDDDILREFENVLPAFAGRKALDWYRKNLKKGRLIGVGLGVDVIAGEKRVYLMYEGRNPSLKGLIVSWDGKKILEDKTYIHDHKGRVILKGNLYGKRLQYDVQKGGKNAIRYIWRLKGLPVEYKLYLIRIIRDGYNLDTVSFGKKRGWAFYFD